MFGKFDKFQEDYLVVATKSSVRDLFRLLPGSGYLIRVFNFDCLGKACFGKARLSWFYKTSSAEN